MTGDTTPLVLVLDDDKGVAERTKHDIGEVAGARVELLQDAQAELARLEGRRRRARDRPGSPFPDDSPFDQADVLVVDYDLINQDQGGPAETGERVAYLARCYSRCRTIVALNQFADTKTFDLTLVGHVGSYADHNLTADDIGNPGLWGRDHDGYHPWSWPDLSRAPVLQDARVDILRRPGALDMNVLELLGLQEADVANALTRSQLAWLSPSVKSPREATVREAVAGGRLGLRPKDKATDDEALARIAAARLAKWLDRLVLPGQDVVVDAPHLLTRFPSLRQDDALAPALSRDPDSTGGVSPRADAHRLDVGPWLGRPAWRWPTLGQDDAVDEVRDPFATVDPGVVFAEDSSAFRDPADCRAFAADVEPFSERYVTRAPDYDTGEHETPPWAGRYGLRDVAYQPAVRFALL